MANIVPGILGALDVLVGFAKDKAPGVITSVKGTVETVLDALSGIGGGKMSVEETAAARAKLLTELDSAKADIHGAVPPPLSDQSA